MVCYRISGKLHCLKSTPTARITQANTYLTNGAAEGIKLSDDYYTKSTLTDGTTLLAFSIRYTTASARDTLKTNLFGRVNAYMNTAYYSWLEVHECYHDITPPQACNPSVIQTWGTKPNL